MRKSFRIDMQHLTNLFNAFKELLDNNSKNGNALNIFDRVKQYHLLCLITQHMTRG